MTDELIVLRQGDARDLSFLPDATVQCCITSPPYWGLRDYGLATWEGGDAGCDHDVAGQVQDSKAPGAITSGVRPGAGNVCRKCGAVRHDAGIGLEKTPEEYVANIVHVFREVWRVLRDDGTLWLNLGDCYAGSWGYSGHRPELDGTPSHQRPKNVEYLPRGVDKDFRQTPPTANVPGLKPKDLVGIPWRVAFALQADGWYLRSDIVWAKPNPMPESVTDRPTKAHEYLFLLTKSARYYYDAEAVREDAVCGENRATFRGGGTYTNNRSFDNDNPATGDGETRERPSTACRNRRTVWTIPTQPYKGAHFATYPEKLVEPCVLAGTSPKACGVCGAPWARVVEREVKPPPDRKNNNEFKHDSMTTHGEGAATLRNIVERSTLGWRPTCDHNDDTGSCIVLDPFCGSGTTGVVAKRHNRKFIGVDMSADYLEMARKRIESTQRMLAGLA